jgi:8-oxo-dGTP pyrophosphatase MutT (NUDIX family)
VTDPTADTQPPGSGGLRIREAVRALVIDPDDRVLLVRFEFPDGIVWASPGGGMEPDEDHETALRRELDEELGIGATADIGPPVWERTHIFPFVSGLWDGQHEIAFLVRTPRFEPQPHLTPEELAAEFVMELRWWTVDELHAFETSDDAWFAPRRLPELVAEVVANGPPPEPLDVGV